MSAEPVEVLNAHRSAKGVQRTQGLTVVATQPFLERGFQVILRDEFVVRIVDSWRAIWVAGSRRDRPQCGSCNKARRNADE
jgi:hypothetical protein